MQPVAAFILQEIKGQILASLPHLVEMLVALTLQSFVVPMGSAKILDDAGDDLTERIKYLAAYQLLAVACNALQRRLSEGRAHAVRSRLQAQGYERVLRLDDKALDDAKVGELVQTLRDPGAAWLACEFPAAALNARSLARSLAETRLTKQAAASEARIVADAEARLTDAIREKESENYQQLRAAEARASARLTEREAQLRSEAEITKQDAISLTTEQLTNEADVRPVSYTHLTLPTKRIV